MNESPFALFSPDAFALITEATMLGHKLGRHMPLGCSLIWAAWRCVERGDAVAPTLRALNSVALTEFLDRGVGVPSARIERTQACNTLEILPPVPRHVGSSIDISRPVGARHLFAATLAMFDFRYMGNYPLLKAGIDLKALHLDLVAGRQFMPTSKMTDRGCIPPERTRLFGAACGMAASINEWLVTSLTVAVSEKGHDEGCQASDVEKNEWTSLLAKRNRVRVETRNRFDGVRPWTSAAAPLLGVPLPVDPIP